jgi:putrescine transport system ATP-binding protein
VDGKPGEMVWVALRPEKVRITREQSAGTCVSGEVIEIGYLGDISIYKVRLGSGFIMKAVLANLTRQIERPIGWHDRVWLDWRPDAAVMLTR